MSTPTPGNGNSIIWEEPKPAWQRFGRVSWMELLTPLMEHPGRWARVLTEEKRNKPSYYVSAIKGGHLHLRVPPGRWDAVSRRIYEGDDQGKFAVYVRYLGPVEK